MIKQLVLNGLRLRDDATFDNFFPGQNAQVLALLQDYSEYSPHWFTYLWGKAESGRTHLLNAICIKAKTQGKSTIYLPMLDLITLKPDVFDELEQYDWICLDDAQLIAGQAAWETAFFHLYNRLQQHQRRLIITADKPPRELPINLLDLKSRLTAGTIFQLQNLNDEEKLAALQLRAQARGMMISDEVGYFLLRRASRSIVDLFNLLDKLDHASLAAQRRLTIPFVKTVLGL